MWYIFDEFQCLVLVYFDFFFSLYYNDFEIYYFMFGNFCQCIVGVFGKSFNQCLVFVLEDIDIFKMLGFVGKLEFVKKS